VLWERRPALIGRTGILDEELKIRPVDIDRLIEWLRRTGRPQTAEALARHYLDRLRQELLRGR
jgi:hypothetical protein